MAHTISAVFRMSPFHRQRTATAGEYGGAKLSEGGQYVQLHRQL